MSDSGDLGDFNYALFLLKMFVRFKRIVLTDEVAFYFRDHAQDYVRRSFNNRSMFLFALFFCCFFLIGSCLTPYEKK